jgi:hypothetical protein
VAITKFDKCNGLFRIGDATPAAGLVDLNVALNCRGHTGGGVAAPFEFVLNGQRFGGCTLINFNDNSGEFDIICGSSQTAAEDCGHSVLATGSNPTDFPHATLSVPTFTFHAN